MNEKPKRPKRLHDHAKETSGKQTKQQNVSTARQKRPELPIAVQRFVDTWPSGPKLKELIPAVIAIYLKDVLHFDVQVVVQSLVPIVDKRKVD